MSGRSVCGNVTPSVLAASLVNPTLAIFTLSPSSNPWSAVVVILATPRFPGACDAYSNDEILNVLPVFCWSNLETSPVLAT